VYENRRMGKGREVKSVMRIEERVARVRMGDLFMLKNVE
jgi:hypothetical protein